MYIYMYMYVALPVCYIDNCYTIAVISPLQVILYHLSTQEANFDVSKAQRGMFLFH